MTNLFMENNNVMLLGKVAKEPILSHEVYGEKFYQFNLEAKRLSGSVDVIPILFSERFRILESLKVGAIVKLNGQFRSYNSTESGRSKLILGVFAREIILTEASEEEDKNEIYLKGFVCKKPNYRITPLGREISDLLIAVTRAYNKSDYIPCIVLGKNAKYCETFNVGDKIIVYGKIRSREYERKDDNEEVEIKVAYEVNIKKLEIEKNEEIEKAEIVRNRIQKRFKYCLDCRKMLPDKANFCYMCGKKIDC